MLFKSGGGNRASHTFRRNPIPGWGRGDCPARCGTIAAKDERPASRVCARAEASGGRAGKSTIVRRDAWTVKGP